MSSLLQINATANLGSTGKIAEGIGLSAMNRGWKSVIAYGRYANLSQSRLIKIGNRCSVYTHYVRNRLFDTEGLGSRRATRGLIKRIKEQQPNIIHLHNIHDHWLNYPILFEYLATTKTPIVWTFHDCWAFTGGCAHFDMLNCYKWQRGCENCPNRKGIDNSHRNFDLKSKVFASLKDRMTIVPVSHWLEEFCSRSLLGDCRIELLHNGIEIGKFRPQREKFPKFTVLVVAQFWNKKKGLEDFYTLWRLLPNTIDIVLVGLSGRQMKSLPQGIQGIEQTQSIAELVDVYSGAAVFVNPTYEDNFPTVNLEALACGTPVITYRTGGSPEAIDEKTGMIVEKGNVKGLAEAVMRVFNNPEMFSSKDCVDRANSLFNQEIQFAKYIDLYEDLLGGW